MPAKVGLKSQAAPHSGPWRSNAGGLKKPKRNWDSPRVLGSARRSGGNLQALPKKTAPSSTTCPHPFPRNRTGPIKILKCRGSSRSGMRTGREISLSAKTARWSPRRSESFDERERDLCGRTSGAIWRAHCSAIFQRIVEIPKAHEPPHLFSVGLLFSIFSGFKIQGFSGFCAAFGRA